MSVVRLVLDGGALVANWRTLDRMSGAARTGAAVKANGYGLGVRDVVRRLAQAGCADFFVAHWTEAEEIADLVDPGCISVLNGVGPGDVERARALGAKPVLNSPEQAARWRAAGGGRCDVMIDTGMNRLGISAHDFDADMLRGLDIDIAMSHLVSSEEADNPVNARQLAAYRAVLPAISCRRASLANSGGVALGADYHFDLTRPGLALYGGVPNEAFAEIIAPVAHPEAALLQVRIVRAGDTIGYNGIFTAPRDMTVGIAAIGYADGYWRGFSNSGCFEHQGRALPVAGRVSMDLTALDLTAAPELREGDWVRARYALPEAAAQSGFSQYELLTGLGQRFERVWRD